MRLRVRDHRHRHRHRHPVVVVGEDGNVPRDGRDACSPAPPGNNDGGPSSPRHHRHHFVRLSPRTARALHSIALAEAGKEAEADADAAPGRVTESSGDVDHFWTVLDDARGSHGEGPMIEFLPLRIVEVVVPSTSSSSPASASGCEGGGVGRVAYSSYNGGSLSLSPSRTTDTDGGGGDDHHDEDDDGAIELPRHLFERPPLPTYVDVHPLHRVPDARRVEAEPLTPEDWELIECHADFLEDGGWLGQVSVVYPGQVVTLSLGGGGGGEGGGVGGGPRDVARVRMLPRSFRVHDADTEDDDDDDDEEDGEDDDWDDWDSGEWESSSDFDMDSDGEENRFGDDRGGIGGGTPENDGEGHRSPAGICVGDDDDDLIRYIHPAVDDEEEESESLKRNGGMRMRRMRRSSRSEPKPHWRCLRLVRDTELLVLPRETPRRRPTSSGRNEPSPPLRVAPALADVPRPVLRLWDLVERHRRGGVEDDVDVDEDEDGGDRGPLRPPPLPAGPRPLCVRAHPETLSSRVPGWEGDDRGSVLALLWRYDDGTTSSPSSSSSVAAATSRVDGDDADYADAAGSVGAEGAAGDGFSPVVVSVVVRVFPSGDVPMGHVALHPLLGVQVDACPLYDHVRLRILTGDEVGRARGTTSRAGLVSTDDDLTGVSLSRVTIGHDPRQRGTTSVLFPDEADVAQQPLHCGGDRGEEEEDGAVGAAPTASLLDDVRDVLLSLPPGDDDDDDPIPISSGTLLPIPRRRRRRDGEDGGRGGDNTAECIYRVQLSFRDAQCGGGSGTTDITPVLEPQAGRDGRGRRPDGGSGGVDDVPPFLSAGDLARLLLSRRHPDMDAPMLDGGGRRIVIVAGGSRRHHRDLFGMLPATNPSVCGMEDATVTSLDHFVRRDPPRPSAAKVVAASADAVPRGRRRHRAVVEGGLILHGGDGAGKTHCALNVAALLRVSTGGVATVYLDCRRLQSTEHRMGGILSKLTEIFERSVRCSPSLLILDDLDALVPDCGFEGQPVQSAGQHQQPSSAFFDQAKLVADHIVSLRDEVVSSARGGTNHRGGGDVAFLCTCRTAKSVHASLRSLGVGLFDACVEVPPLSPAARSDVLQTMLSSRSVGRYHEDRRHPATLHSVPMDAASFGRRTEGYCPSDLKSVALRIQYRLNLQSMGRRLPSESVHTKDALHIDVDVVEKVIRDYVPSSLQNARLSHPTAKWDDVGGLVEAKSKLIDAVLKPVRYARIYRHSPVKLPRGLLLFGPPGCGKTLMASALADLCGLNLVTCRGAELLDKYIGASEAKVREIFHRAAAAAPSLIFFDDFDALAPKRGADNTGVTDRVVNQLLTFLDGVETLNKTKGSTVYVVAATSRPDRIDSALLRPGRLDKHVYVGFPENDVERTGILSTLARKWTLSNRCLEAVRSGALLRRVRDEDDVAADDVWEKISLLSAADLKAVLDTAYLEAVHSHLQNRLDSSGSRLDKNENTGGLDDPEVCIDEDCLMRALCRSNPSMSQADRAFFLSIYEAFSGNNSMLRKGGNEQRKDEDGIEGIHSLSWTRNVGDILVQETALR